MKTKEKRLNYLRKGISTNPQWARRAVLRVFENQTADEQSSEYTKYSNGLGFNGTDAVFCSSIAKQLLDGRDLSPKQDAAIMRCMKKYAAQVLAVTDVELLDQLIERSENKELQHA